MKTAIIFCNGSPIRKNILQKIKVKFQAHLIAADGGSNYLYELGESPEFIIGDLDSIKTDILKFFQSSGTKIFKISRQNDTDLEKALKLCKKLKFSQIFIAGFTGKRFDHALSNISNALKFADAFKIFMIENNSVIELITGTKRFSSFRGEVVSLLCFDPGVRITTRKLKYPLINESLMFGQRESTSNVSIADYFEISVSNGFALLIRSTKNFLKYD